MKRLLPFLILLAMGCSNPTDSPLELANAFQKAIERKDYEKAYNFIDDSLKEQTIPEDLELFFSSEESVLSGEASGKLLPVVASYPTFRIIEFSDSNPSDSCDITDIVVVRNRDNIWSVVWADHLSSEVTIYSSTNPFSTRNRFYRRRDYRGDFLSSVIPNERFVRLKKLENILGQEAVFYDARFHYGISDPNPNPNSIIEDAQSLKLLFHLGVRTVVEDAIEYCLNEATCIGISDKNDKTLLALSQYILLENKDDFWITQEEFIEAFSLSRYFFVRLKTEFDATSWSEHQIGRFWRFFPVNHFYPSRRMNRVQSNSVDMRKSVDMITEAIEEEHSKASQFMQDIQHELQTGQPSAKDIMNAAHLLAMVKDKGNPEYIATMALVNDVGKRSKTKKSAHPLTAAELQICEQSFSGMRDFYEHFELKEFCSCVFHSSAGFETFLDSPGEYLKENEDCLERYLFRPAGMSEEDIESYWTGVDKASQPVTRDGFATSCAEGLLMLPEFKEIDLSSAQEFCLCIYDEAEGKGLAMDDLMTSAGDDIAEACGHLISP